MAALNAAIIPCLIAEYGIYYADLDNVDTATHMIAQVIQSQQLGGYTARTFPAAADGHRVYQVAFSTLYQICFVYSMYLLRSAALYDARINKLANTALHVRKGQHHTSQGYS
jgi:hypothetical protein